ncbi:MAG: hypothetical protein ACKO38_05610 [Planctomycetota bacterium]
MSRRFAWVVPCVSVFVFGFAVASAAAADRQDTIAQAGSTNAGKAETIPTRKKLATGAVPAPLTPEREAVALKFIEQHHPELAELLAALKPTSPTQYGQAIQDLFRASERINLARTRDPQRSNLELQLWKTQSRRDLVAVRLRMARTPELESQLRQLIQEHLELQQSLLRLERERVAERLRKLDEQLASGNREAHVEQQFQQLVTRPRAGVKPAPKISPKPVLKSPAKTTATPMAKSGGDDNRSANLH